MSFSIEFNKCHLSHHLGGKSPPALSAHGPKFNLREVYGAEVPVNTAYKCLNAAYCSQSVPTLAPIVLEFATVISVIKYSFILLLLFSIAMK